MRFTQPCESKENYGAMVTAAQLKNFTLVEWLNSTNGVWQVKRGDIQPQKLGHAPVQYREW